jgi:hypothetical protein
LPRFTTSLSMIVCFAVASGCETDPHAGRAARQPISGSSSGPMKASRVRPDPAAHDGTDRPLSRPRRALSPRPVPRAAPLPPLAEACRARAAWLRKRLPARFHIEVSPPYVVTGDLGRHGVQYNLKRGVLKPAKALHATYFHKRPLRPITILLFKKYKTYAHWAKRLFNDTDVAYYGYFKPSTRTMVMNIGPGIGTLYHELTHALMAVDFPNVPDWFNEGLASLHEGAYVSRNRLVGMVNWRFPALRQALRKGKLRSLADLVAKDDFYTYRVGMNYAQARHFALFMQRRKLLRKFYRYFRDHPGTDLGRSALEHIFGYQIPRIDREYRAFLRRMRRGR